MGMTVQSTELIIDRLILLITYFTVIPIIGYVRAWVADKMGDDTPKQLGFLTLNPLEHVSFFWLAIMMLGITPFGFGRYIPINPHNFYGKWRSVKMVVAYLSDAFASIAMAVIALFCFVLFFGANPYEFLVKFAHAHTAAYYSQYAITSSFAIVTALLLRNIVFFNSMLAAFNTIVNLFYAGFFYFYTSKQNAIGGGDHIQWSMLVGPIIVLILFVDVVQSAIIHLIVMLGMWFWQLINVVS